MKSRKIQSIAGAAAALALLATAGIASAAAGGPSVVLSSTASSTTNATSVPVTVTFSEPVDGFSSAGASTTNATVSDFSGSGSTYTFTLSPSSQGAFSVFVPTDAATSASSSIGNQQSNTLSFTYDTTAPAISGVSVAATTTSATITWTTDEAAYGQVNYGTSTSYGSSSTLEATSSTSHSTTLANLSPSTTYHYQISATDAAGNMATTSDATFMTAASSSPAAAPAISDISVSDIGTSTATVNWTTDIASNSQVNYGTSTAYGATASDATATTTHSVMLTTLSEATLYHFDVQSSASASSTAATSTDMEFVTESTASTTPLAIDGISTTQSSGVADDTYTDGWQWVIHFTTPDTENAFRIRFSDWGNASSSFPTANDVEIYSPESSNASTSASAITETDNGYGDWLYLDGDTGTTTPGRQIDLYVNVKIPFGTPAGSYSSNFTAETYPSSATSTAI